MSGSTDGAGRAPQGIRLTVGAVAIDVHSEDASALAWLAEFLEPAFSVQSHGVLAQDGEEAQHVVEVEQAPAEHARLRQAFAAAQPTELDVFTEDGQFSRHPGWREPDGRRWIYDEKHDAFCGVGPGARSIRLVAGEPRFPRLTLMRVVRELATTALLGSGRLPVHGAGFVHKDIAVLVCGPKRSGKSSLLIHALRCGAGFISNDRLFVGDEDTPVAQPMPTIVMLRDGSLTFFEELKKAMQEARFDRVHTIEECAPGTRAHRRYMRPGRPRRGLSPAQFCRVAGSSMHASAPVGMLLFPRIDAAADGIVLERLAAEAAAERMGESLLRPCAPTRSSALFTPSHASEEFSADAELRRCRSLVERVPAYDCRLGPNAFQQDLARVLPTTHF